MEKLTEAIFKEIMAENFLRTKIQENNGTRVGLGGTVIGFETIKEEEDRSIA